MQALKAVVTENGDSDALMAIEDTYNSRSVVEVSTARPLGEESKAVLTKALEHLGAVDGVRFAIDPTLIGGIKIRLGEREIDRSIRARLVQFVT